MKRYFELLGDALGVACIFAIGYGLLVFGHALGL